MDISIHSLIQCSDAWDGRFSIPDPWIKFVRNHDWGWDPKGQWWISKLSILLVEFCSHSQNGCEWELKSIWKGNFLIPIPNQWGSGKCNSFKATNASPVLCNAQRGKKVHHHCHHHYQQQQLLLLLVIKYFYWARCQVLCGMQRWGR